MRNNITAHYYFMQIWFARQNKSSVFMEMDNKTISHQGSAARGRAIRKSSCLLFFGFWFVLGEVIDGADVKEESFYSSVWLQAENMKTGVLVAGLYRKIVNINISDVKPLMTSWRRGDVTSGPMNPFHVPNSVFHLPNRLLLVRLPRRSPTGSDPQL